MEFLKITDEYAAQAAVAEKENLDTAWSEAQIREAVGNNDILYIVAVESGKLYAAASCIFSMFDAQIANIAVVPERRRQGIASRMLALIEKEARDRKLEQICLEVASKNKGAIALYRLAGFTEAGIRKGFYRRSNDDAIIMTKGISL